MIKLPSLNSKQLIKILQKRGFQLDHSTGSHFIFYHPHSRKRVVVPYHNKDLPKGTVYAILKQADIPREEWYT